MADDRQRKVRLMDAHVQSSGSLEGGEVREERSMGKCGDVGEIRGEGDRAPDAGRHCGRCWDGEMASSCACSWQCVWAG